MSDPVSVEAAEGPTKAAPGIAKRGGYLPELFIKGAGVLFTLVPVLVGIWQFRVQEQHRVEEEFGNHLWLEQLNGCRTLGDLVGKVTAYADDASFKDSIRGFRAAYWGAMILTEGRSVERAMIDFNLAIDDVEDKRTDVPTLKKRAKILLDACQCEVESSPWAPARMREAPGRACRS